MTHSGAQDPRDYLKNLAAAQEEGFRNISPGAAPPQRVASANGDNGAAVTEFARFAAKAQSEMYALTLELHDTEREAITLGKEVENLNEIVTGLKAKLEETGNAHLTEKTELESAAKTSEASLADLQKQLADQKAEFEQKLAEAQTAAEEKATELQGKIEELTGQVTTLTDEKTALESEKTTLTAAKEEAEKNAQKLGAKKLGLVAPADKEKELSTESGDAIVPTKELSAAQAAAAARAPGDAGDGTAAETEMAELLEVYNEYCNLAAVQNHVSGRPSTGAEEREERSFLNDARPGCEGCKADPQHHAKLVKAAIFRRKEVIAFAQASA